MNKWELDAFVARNVRCQFWMKLRGSVLLPQLCAQRLPRRASRPPRCRAGGLAETCTSICTTEVHGSHLLIHL